MSQSIRPQLTRWKNTYNRRRLWESFTEFGGYLIGLMGTVTALHFASCGVPLFHIGLGLVVLTGAASLVAYRRLRSDEYRMALAVDRAHKTHDLLSTAWAVETGAMECDKAMGESVRGFANERLPKLNVDRIGPFTMPRWSPVIAIAGVVFALISFGLHEPLLCQGHALAAATTPVEDGLDENANASDTDSDTTEENPALDPEAIAELTAQLEHLRELSERLQADASTHDTLDSVQRDLERALDPSSSETQALGALARAERQLSNLAQEAQDTGLLSEDELNQATPEELAESLREAIEQGDAETAATLVQELAERTATAEGAELSELGEAIEESGRDGGEMPEQSVGMSDEARERADQQLSSAGQEMSQGDRSGAMQELNELLEDLSNQAAAQGSPSQESIEEALSSVRNARSEQLNAQNNPGNAGEPQAGENGESGEQGESSMPGGQMGQMNPSDMAGRPTTGQRGVNPSQNPGGRGQSGEGQRGEGQDGQGQSGQNGEGEGQDGQGISRLGQGDWGVGGTSHGPGQGPTPEPFEGPLPPLDMPSTEWLESQWGEGFDMMIQLIETASHGERSQIEIQRLLQTYAEIAEATHRREDIPLTRRDYIQAYFEAIRH